LVLSSEQVTEILKRYPDLTAVLVDEQFVSIVRGVAADIVGLLLETPDEDVGHSASSNDEWI
jgi:hypothetical protein